MKNRLWKDSVLLASVGKGVVFWLEFFLVCEEGEVWVLCLEGKQKLASLLGSRWELMFNLHTRIMVGSQNVLQMRERKYRWWVIKKVQETLKLVQLVREWGWYCWACWFNPHTGHSLKTWAQWSLWVLSNSEYLVILKVTSVLASLSVKCHKSELNVLWRCG